YYKEMECNYPDTSSPEPTMQDNCCANCSDCLTTIGTFNCGSLSGVMLCQACTGPQICDILTEFGACQTMSQLEQPSAKTQLACLLCPWLTLFSSSMAYLEHYISVHEAEVAGDDEALAMAAAVESVSIDEDFLPPLLTDWELFSALPDQPQAATIEVSDNRNFQAAPPASVINEALGVRSSQSKRGSHVCKVCGRGFRLTWRFELHTKAARCRPGSRQPRSASGRGSYRRKAVGEDRTCLTCGKVFANSMNLHRHELIHAGIRPHRCHLCGKGFVQKTQLTAHLNSHSGARPYKCRLCGSAFSDRSTYSKHVRRHSQE
ncbi:hypothetical protein BOX15_Mlig018060g1, partial [Macrostomum lignano]